MKLLIIPVEKTAIVKEGRLTALLERAKKMIDTKAILLYASKPSFDYQSLSKEKTNTISLIRDTIKKESSQFAQKEGIAIAPLGRTIDIFDVKYKNYISFWECCEEVLSLYETGILIIPADIAVQLHHNVDQFRKRKIMPELFQSWNGKEILCIDMQREISCITFCDVPKTRSNFQLVHGGVQQEQEPEKKDPKEANNRNRKRNTHKKNPPRHKKKQLKKVYGDDWKKFKDKTIAA
jgi:hypothetical protein